MFIKGTETGFEMEFTAVGEYEAEMRKRVYENERWRLVPAINGETLKWGWTIYRKNMNDDWREWKVGYGFMLETLEECLDVIEYKEAIWGRDIMAKTRKDMNNG